MFVLKLDSSSVLRVEVIHLKCMPFQLPVVLILHLRHLFLSRCINIYLKIVFFSLIVRVLEELRVLLLPVVVKRYPV